MSRAVLERFVQTGRVTSDVRRLARAALDVLESVDPTAQDFGTGATGGDKPRAVLARRLCRALGLVRARAGEARSATSSMPQRRGTFFSRGKLAYYRSNHLDAHADLVTVLNGGSPGALRARVQEMLSAFDAATTTRDRYAAVGKALLPRDLRYLRGRNTLAGAERSHAWSVALQREALIRRGQSATAADVEVAWCESVSVAYVQKAVARWGRVANATLDVRVLIERARD